MNGLIRRNSACVFIYVRESALVWSAVCPFFEDLYVKRGIFSSSRDSHWSRPCSPRLNFDSMISPELPAVFAHAHAMQSGWPESLRLNTSFLPNRDCCEYETWGIWTITMDPRYNKTLDHFPGRLADPVVCLLEDEPVAAGLYSWERTKELALGRQLGCLER